MAGVLCIDFGTSSIRAVRRLPAGRRKPLDIGRVTHSRLDDASIRSEIHVDEQGRNVRYGERAIAARRQPEKPMLYEPSAKLWLKNPQALYRPAVAGTALTRANLLAGLLANALRACIDADSISASTMDQTDVRVAHPVWPPEIADQANLALKRICAQARRMAFERDWATVAAATLATHTAVQDAPGSGSVDVIEPNAAAVELLPSDENVRRICAVIDVGAGTTDIGLFEAVAPDPTTSVRGKLYPLGSPKSVFKAGNMIDEIVLDLLLTRAKRPNVLAVDDIRSRIRQVKETMFRDGYIQELGVDVQLEDLQSHPEAKAIARDIRSELEAVVHQGRETIGRLIGAKTHAISRLEVVMAGGGGAIAFICSAVSRPFAVNGKTLAVEVMEAETEPGVNLFGAGRGRMAVALGGASLDYDALIHQRPRVTMVRLGPM